LRTIVANLFKSRRSDFPGCQPVSFGQRHLAELEQNNYFVSEKADGIRVLLFTNLPPNGHPQTFLIDRKNKYYFLAFGLPREDNFWKYQTNTIIDGELVLDEVNGKQSLSFLAFDCVSHMNKSLVDRPYTKRLGHLTANIINPYKERVRNDQKYAQSRPFKLDLKKLELSYGLDRVLDSISQLNHKNDGLIFTSETAPYGIGTCETMMKWKPPEENTVDFLIRVKGDETPRFWLQIWEGDRSHRDVCELILEDERRAIWERDWPDGRVVECRYDVDWPNHWRFSRFRDDKRTANHWNTYRRIMETINDPVHIDDVRTFCHLVY
ncbi:mRNA capping enzyme, catalytic domain-containing protein, partial [Zopfochytrium polystomum]